MEKEVLISTMRNSISDVLETMFFMPLEFSEAADLGELWSMEQDSIMVTRVKFKGPFEGHFDFFIPKDLARSLADSFLGEDEGSISHENVTETIKEMINMIAGNTFSLYDSQAVFDLGIPELLHFDGTAEKGHGPAEEILVVVNTLDNSLAFQMVIYP
jgi:CheY-specific phosphatase CheX